MGHHFDDFRFIDMLTFCIALAAFILALVYNPQKEQFQGAVVPIGVDENPLLYTATIELTSTALDGQVFIPFTVSHEMNPSGAFGYANNTITFTPPSSDHEYFYEVEVVFTYMPNAFTGRASFFIGYGTGLAIGGGYDVRMDTTVDTGVSCRLTAIFQTMPQVPSAFLLGGVSESTEVITMYSGSFTVKAIRGAPL